MDHQGISSKGFTLPLPRKIRATVPQTEWLQVRGQPDSEFPQACLCLCPAGMWSFCPPTALPLCQSPSLRSVTCCFLLDRKTRFCLGTSSVHVQSCPIFFATPWTVALRAPLSMGFSRQEYWSGLPFPFSRGSSRPRDQNLSLLHWQPDSLPLCHLRRKSQGK